MPFLNSNLLSFLAVSFFFCCSCFLVFIVYVSAFLFLSCYVGFVFGVFVLFFLCFCFCSSFLFCFQSLKKVVFPANLVFFWVMLVKRVVWSLCFMFLFLFVFLVLFLSTLKNSFVLFCFCVVVFCHKTKWSSCLYFVVLLPFLFFLLFCFEFCLFSFLSKKRPPKNRIQQKPQKTKMQKKRTKTKKKLAQLCSQIVFLIFLGWA